MKAPRHPALLCYALACGVGGLLAAWCPFPADNLFLRFILEKRPVVYHLLGYSYAAFLFTTPYLALRVLCSLLVVHAWQPSRAVPDAVRLPPYPPLPGREDLFVVVGEVHHPRKPLPAADPAWLAIPDRGACTGMICVGAVGTGKTTCFMVPAMEQILAFRAPDPARRVGGLVLEVKGDFCHKVRALLERHGRGEDYVEIGLGSPYVYNPLHNDLDAYALAYQVAQLINNLYGKSREPFWQMAYTNAVKFSILLHKLRHGYVTLYDVYHSLINRSALEELLKEAEKRFAAEDCILLPPAVVTQYGVMERFGMRWDEARQGFLADRAAVSDDEAGEPLADWLSARGIDHEVVTLGAAGADDGDRRDQLEAVKRWFHHDWCAIDAKLRTSIVEGISVFLSLFDDNPAVKRVFCPPPEAYDPGRNGDGRFGRPFPGFAWAVENGKVVCLNFPLSANPGLARTIGTLMKLDYQRAMLLRIPEMEQGKGRHFRPSVFCCDEYQNFATAGESDPNGDEKFFSLSRQAKCIPLVATQSLSSLRSALPGETWRTLLQTFRTKIFLALSDDFSQKLAAELCGREDKLKINYNYAESSNDARLSFLSGLTTSDKGSVSTSKSYNVQRDFVFDARVFAELKNAQAVVLAFDGVNPRPPCFCYLKPCYLSPDKSWFHQVRDGEL